MDRDHVLPKHFDRVAPKYAQVRYTDPKVIGPIIRHLPGHSRVLHVMDVGCGTGRYTDIFARRFRGRLRLYCCDYSRAMLAECRKRMNRRFPRRSIHYCRVNADDLPFADASFDGIVTFNAVHHFNLDRFVTAASRLLRAGGLLSIYTRTPDQNGRTVWGQYFPGFIERETRLYPRERLEKAINRAGRLKVEGIHEFSNTWKDSVASLLHRARSLHYSTFALYPPEEFRQAVDRFGKKLQESSESGLVAHVAENTLVLARRM